MPVNMTEFTHELPQTDDFKSIVLKQIPLIDVRAPVEFNQGAFSLATNIPLMNDEQRHQVGLCYKNSGNAAAVKLGHQLVDEVNRKQIVTDWMQYVDKHPTAMLYCFRGGMRSKISQQWLQDNGCEITRLKGGYKAFRRYLIDYLDNLPGLLKQMNIQPTILAGRTGAGKTLVISQLNNAIDLEGLAHHRGSAFGRHATPQPTQIDFENQMAMNLIRLLETQPKTFVVEDEGRNIGSVNFSKGLFDCLKNGDRVVVETPLEQRIAITLDEYVVQAQQEYPDLQAWTDFMESAFTRIQKRLGGERSQKVRTYFSEAMQKQHSTGCIEGHKAWIETLLTEYYDPMYDYQMQKNNHSVVFSGTMDEVVQYLK